jgi:hypothetical protein
MPKRDLPLSRTIITIWVDSFRAAKTMPRLLATVFALVTGVFLFVNPFGSDSADVPWRLARVFTEPGLVGLGSLAFFFAGPWAVAIHRFVLLGEAAERWGANIRTILYFVYSFISFQLVLKFLLVAWSVFSKNISNAWEAVGAACFGVLLISLLGPLAAILANIAVNPSLGDLASASPGAWRLLGAAADRRDWRFWLRGSLKILVLTLGSLAPAAPCFAALFIFCARSPSLAARIVFALAASGLFLVGLTIAALVASVIHRDAAEGAEGSPQP